jgi:Zn-dependent peptidase ImmA (M78 family)/transcriptional regulator with XRE-family HTH domain
MQDHMISMTLTGTRLGLRLRALREQRDLSQEALSQALGFRDRQTLSAIETGERRLSAEELLRAVQALGVSVDQLVDPFQLTGEGRFSWRHTGISPGRLESFEAVAGRWIAAFREIAPQVGHERPLLRKSLGLHKGSTFEEAMAAGERFATEFELGEVPADRLPMVMEEELHILVLMVDATPGISGAACRLPGLDAVLINRKEVEGRRNFDLAHELFHVLTWETMPPDHVEEADQGAGRGKVEQLANAFAGALLMPAHLLGMAPPRGFAEGRGDGQGYGDGNGGGSSGSFEDGPASVRRLKALAARLEVSAVAVKWRLVALGRLSRKEALAIDDRLLREGKSKMPPLFSRQFMDVLARAIDEGQVSARRAADLVNLNLEDLADLFRAYGVQAPFEL